MKLAEALVLRADVQKRIAQLRERLRQSALVQEGEQPPENPEQLLIEMDQLLNQLGDLIIRKHPLLEASLVKKGCVIICLRIWHNRHYVIMKGTCNEVERQRLESSWSESHQSGAGETLLC